MKVSSYTLALLLAASSTLLAVDNAAAQATDLQAVKAEQTAPAPFHGHRAFVLLGLETKLHSKDVQRVLATAAINGRHLYRAHRNKALQFEQALGTERYEGLIAGNPIALHSPEVLEAARAMLSSDASASLSLGAWDEPVSIRLAISP